MLLLLKVLLAPALVVLSSLAGRRFGPGVAGVLVTLPIVAGPILLVLALEQGASFASRAATTSLLGIVALAVFGVTFAAAGRRMPWFSTLAVSWAAVLAVDLALLRVRVPALVGLVLAVAAVHGAAALLRRRVGSFPRLGPSSIGRGGTCPPGRPPPRRSSWDSPGSPSCSALSWPAS